MARCAHSSTFRVGAGIALCFARIALASTLALAQGNAPLSYFQALPRNRLATLQGKLTFLGLSLHRMPGLMVLFGGPSADTSVAGFIPFYDPRVDYHYDRVPEPGLFEATEAELDKMIDSVATLPAVVDTTPDARNIVEFALLDTAGGTARVFESRLNTDNARLLLGRMRGGLEGNSEALAVLGGYACGLGILSAATPSERTSQVALEFGGLRRNWTTQEFVGKIRVTNTSNATIRGPVYLLLEIHASNVELVDPDGYTCQPLRMGSPPVKLATPYFLLAPTSLARNASVEVPVRFRCPELDSPNVTGRVFAGAGDL